MTPVFLDTVGLIAIWDIESGGLIEPTPDEIALAWHDFQAGPVGSAGIVDLTSFAVMRRVGITEVFTNEGMGTLIVSDVNALSAAEQQGGKA